MPAPNPYAKYQDIRLSTVNKGNLVLVLYDGAIKFLEEAKSRMQTKDFAGKGLYLDRAFGAINELRSSLRYDYDKKLAESLNQLYYFMTKQLSLASIKNDVHCIETVIRLLKGLKEAWEEATRKENSNKTIDASLA
jgi:flagellar protein FliS